MVTVAPLLGAACGGDDSAAAGAEAGAGAAGLFVKVTDGEKRPVADAVVTTEPATRSATTDGLGSVFLSNVTAGLYSVTAQHASLGAARAAVTVAGAGITRVELILQVGLVVDGGLPPADGGRIDGGDGGAGGDGGEAGAVADGPAAEAPADPSLALSLMPLSHDGSAVSLTWSPTPDDAFATYRVQRAMTTGGAFEVINIITDVKARSYRDTTVAFGINYQYRVEGVTASGRVVASNVQTISAGTFIALNTQVSAMQVDRTRPYLYAVDTVNNSLHFVNLTSNKLEKTIFIGSKPADLDINVAGTELYVANFGATEIAVVNLDTREKARALAVNTTVGTWDGNPYRLACTAGDTVVFTSMDQWNDLKLVNGLTGAHLFATGSVYTPDVAANADGTRLYVSADEVIRFNVQGNMLVQVDTSDRGGGFGRISVTRDGRFVFAGSRKILSDNLKSVLGTFSEPIFAVTGDGGIAVGAKNIHDGNTFAILRALPVSTTIMAMSADETTLYLYDTMTSRIYLHRLK